MDGEGEGGGRCHVAGEGGRATSGARGGGLHGGVAGSGGGEGMARAAMHSEGPTLHRPLRLKKNSPLHSLAPSPPKDGGEGGYRRSASSGSGRVVLGLAAAGFVAGEHARGRRHD